MGYRRKSRELAMQALFYMDMAKCHSDENLQRFCHVHQPPKKTRPFFLKLVQGVNYMRTSIDAAITKHSDNWTIGRMSGVDRNVMRIAVFEMAFCPDIPHKVSINEAIDIGKAFGYEESGAFINGILDSIHLALHNNTIDIATEIPDTVFKDMDFDDTDSETDNAADKYPESDSDNIWSVPPNVPFQKTGLSPPVSSANSTIKVTSHVRKRLRRENEKIKDMQDELIEEKPAKY
ncbi:transcription antitermination factor NusB [Desulfococcaceae bacterium HSG9]|nr:transcription antitermination factor NusB [Desulfococcaceae bacterium HSG9]